jgi:cytochrome c553
MPSVTLALAVGGTLLAAVFGAADAKAQQSQPAGAQLPSWAYPVLPATVEPPTEDGVVRRLEGSAQSYSVTQILDLFTAKDWFPESHPAMPSIVSQGRKPDVFACGMCHYPNGHGRPENASLAGLPAAYIVQQMADYRNGLRKSSEPKMGPPARMLQTGLHASDEEARAAAEYFSKIKYTPWIRVVETSDVPRHEIVWGSMLGPSKPGGREPIEGRIIELPEAFDRTQLRDDRSGFVAYVPAGSVARGAQLAKTGASKTTACTLCHGADLRGGGDMIPPLAGRSPSYMVRQLYDFQTGARHGPNAILMAPVVANLTVDDVVAVAAYLASLQP